MILHFWRKIAGEEGEFYGGTGEVREKIYVAGEQVEKKRAEIVSAEIKWKELRETARVATNDHVGCTVKHF